MARPLNVECSSWIENSLIIYEEICLKLSFEPFPKNPPISKVFREIGSADELGSGMRNTYKYTKKYSGREPQFIEEDVFRITVPLTEAATTTDLTVICNITKF